MFSQWSLAGVGTAMDMNGRIADDPAFARARTFGSDFFDVSFGRGRVVLGAFLVVFFAGTAALLARSVRR